MKLDLELMPYTGGGALRCLWDSATGTVAGDDAPEVKRYLDAAIQAGHASLQPHGAGFDIADPYHRPEEFAAVFGEMFRLPPELQAVYPIADEEDSAVYLVDDDGTEAPAGHVLH